MLMELVKKLKVTVISAIHDPVSYTHLDVYKRQIVTYSKSMVTGWYTLAMIPVNVFSKNIATDLTRAILILVTIEIILSVTTACLLYTSGNSRFRGDRSFG